MRSPKTANEARKVAGAINWSFETGESATKDHQSWVRIEKKIADARGNFFFYSRAKKMAEKNGMHFCQGLKCIAGRDSENTGTWNEFK